MRKPHLQPLLHPSSPRHLRATLLHGHEDTHDQHLDVTLDMYTMNLSSHTKDNWAEGGCGNGDGLLFSDSILEPDAHIGPLHAKRFARARLPAETLHSH